MQRRHLLILPLLTALPLPLLAAPASLPSEVRAGVDAARAARMAARLGIPVRAVTQDLVAALDAGHLEVALLDASELAAARRRMGERLLVLPGRVAGTGAGLTPVTRRVLPPGLRQMLDTALA